MAESRERRVELFGEKSKLSTKVALLCGESNVFPTPDLLRHWNGRARGVLAVWTTRTRLMRRI